jgi:hypothetical protein
VLIYADWQRLSNGKRLNEKQDNETQSKAHPSDTLGEHARRLVLFHVDNSLAIVLHDVFPLGFVEHVQIINTKNTDRSLYILIDQRPPIDNLYEALGWSFGWSFG